MKSLRDVLGQHCEVRKKLGKESTDVESLDAQALEKDLAEWRDRWRNQFRLIFAMIVVLFVAILATVMLNIGNAAVIGAATTAYGGSAVTCIIWFRRILREMTRFEMAILLAKHLGPKELKSLFLLIKRDL